MQAHPVPQNIMQVEFQLVGNLTLRQFGYIAACGLIAWLIFSSPVLAFIKVPLALGVALFGVALAFLPINDMRLENWIVAFFKAIYSPTRRVWAKRVEEVDFLTDKFARLVTRPALVHTTRANTRARLDLYLSTTQGQVKNKLDEFEDRKLHSLNFQVETPAFLTTTQTLSPEVLPTPTPVETPRIVEAPTEEVSKIASKVIFTPIATIKLPDKNIFVKPLSNKRSHSLNPKTAHRGTIMLPIRGERVFQVSQEIREKLDRYVKPATPTSPSQPEVLLRAESTPMPAAPTPSVNLFTKPAPAPIDKPQTPTAERPVINVFVSQPTPMPTPPPQNIPPFTPTTAPESTPTPPVPEPTEQTTSPATPPQTGENSSLRQNIKQLSAEESQLKGEVERYKSQEKYLQSQLELSQKERGTEGEGAKLKELEEDLKKMQQEKEHAEDRAQRLEGLINQLSTTQPRQTTEREIVTPQAMQTPQAPQIHVVAPRKAEGKMAPPMTTVPNVINGVVKDTNGLLLTGTIIVVKDKNDEPVRALKTNQVGQFAISTALPNGTYLMEVEKEGYEFDYIEIKLNGEILSPIEIRARGGA